MSSQIHGALLQICAMIHPLKPANASGKNVSIVKYVFFQRHFGDLIVALVGSLLLLLPWQRCRIEANGRHFGAWVSPEHLME